MVNQNQLKKKQQRVKDKNKPVIVSFCHRWEGGALKGTVGSREENSLPFDPVFLDKVKTTTANILVEHMSPIRTRY